LTISPVTDHFLEKDFEKLKNLTTGIPVIYLINDNEEDEISDDQHENGWHVSNYSGQKYLSGGADKGGRE
jgi:hypothetical protein